MPAIKQINLIYSFLIESRFRIGRYLLFILAFALISVGQSLSVFGDHIQILGTKVYWFVAGNALIIILFAYFNLSLFVPRLLLKNKYIQYGLVLILGVSLYLIFKSIVEYHILLEVGVVRNITGVTILDGLSNMPIYTISFASSSVSVLLRQWMADSEKINDLTNKHLKTNVEKIKNQINPKSLFNVLDYASEKVKTDSREASDILFILSDVLRYELYDCKREKVLLESDIEFINHYLLLEQLSPEKKITYTIHVTGKTNFFIPPFIFLPVIQQVVERNPRDLIIRFETKNDSLKFECDTSGTDLTLCDFTREQQQLQALYGSDAKFFINVESVVLCLKIC